MMYYLPWINKTAPAFYIMKIHNVWKKRSVQEMSHGKIGL